MEKLRPIKLHNFFPLSCDTHSLSSVLQSTDLHFWWFEGITLVFFLEPCAFSSLGPGCFLLPHWLGSWSSTLWPQKPLSWGPLSWPLWYPQVMLPKPPFLHAMFHCFQWCIWVIISLTSRWSIWLLAPEGMECARCTHPKSLPQCPECTQKTFDKWWMNVCLFIRNKKCPKHKILRSGLVFFGKPCPPPKAPGHWDWPRPSSWLLWSKKGHWSRLQNQRSIRCRVL